MVTINNLKRYFFIAASLCFLVPTDYRYCYADTVKYGNLHRSHNIGCINASLSGVKLNDDRGLNSNFISEITDTQIYKNDGTGRDSTYTIKDPGTAFTMAFAPGFFIHGLGHSYIGEKKTFRFLLLTEMVSLSMYGYGFYLFLPSAFGNPGAGNDGLGGALALGGTFLFFWSWIYDFTVAPNRARELNRIHGYSMYIYPDFRRDFVYLNLKIAF